MARTTFLMLAALLLLLSGCGRKTPPLPPQAVVPRAIDDLSYRLDEKGVELSWSYPERTMQGDRLDSIEEFEIYRAVIPVKDYCPDCPLPFGPPRLVHGGKLPIGVSKRTATFRDSLLRPDYLYFYKIRAKGGWYYSSADSNLISFTWKRPLAAPEKLTATAGDGTIHLSWQAPGRYLDGSAFGGPVSYRLYRAPTAGQPFKVIVRETAKTDYTDINVANGRHYVYAVRALQDAGTNLLAGAAAQSEEVSPRDLTPPPPPSSFSVRQQGTEVFLTWKASLAGDLAGYNIYRRCGTGQRQKIATADPASVGYVDTSAPAVGPLCLYQVSAFDKDGNEGPATQETSAGEQ